jgi:3-oxoacyl-[acyl-carrier protein] reductase
LIGIDLSGKTALVTGASSGLGAEMARTLARAGAKVVVNYHRNADGAEHVANEIRALGGRALAFSADVTDARQVQYMLQGCHGEVGPVTIVVNNAGREEQLGKPFELAWSDYQRMIDLNLKAIYNTASATHPDMKAAGWGRIINIGSVAITRPFPGSAAYTAAKGAMLGITRSLAMELGPDGITVNLIAPGWVPVERHSGAPAEALDRLLKETPLGRIGKPEDVAGPVLFLASELSSFITGTQILVNGGHFFSS